MVLVLVGAALSLLLAACANVASLELAGAVRRARTYASARMVALGAGLGLVVALAASQWIESQLFGVSSTAPWTYLLAAWTAVAVALLATWHPARQAARVDPAITLRSE